MTILHRDPRDQIGTHTSSGPSEGQCGLGRRLASPRSHPRSAGLPGRAIGECEQRGCAPILKRRFRFAYVSTMIASKIVGAEASMGAPVLNLRRACAAPVNAK